MLKKQYSKNKPLCKVTFSLPKEAAEGAREVKVVGEFNNWSWEDGAVMKAGRTAYTADIELTTGRSYQFRYMIDRTRWENDWAADDYQASPFDGIENSVIVLDATPASKKTAAKPAKEKTAKAAAPKKPATETKKATTKKTAEPKKTTTAKKSAELKKATTAKPAAAKRTPVTPGTTSADDLKKIEGIGPKIEQLLHAQGIMTFNDLAKAKRATLQTVLSAAGNRFRMQDPTTWSEQAKLAVKGDWDKLKTLQDELKGGKR